MLRLLRLIVIALSRPGYHVDLVVFEIFKGSVSKTVYLDVPANCGLQTPELNQFGLFYVYDRTKAAATRERATPCWSASVSRILAGSRRSGRNRNRRSNCLYRSATRTNAVVSVMLTLRTSSFRTTRTVHVPAGSAGSPMKLITWPQRYS